MDHTMEMIPLKGKMMAVPHLFRNVLWASHSLVNICNEKKNYNIDQFEP